MQTNFVIPLSNEEVFNQTLRSNSFYKKKPDYESDLMVDSEFNDLSEHPSYNALESPRSKVNENYLALNMQANLMEANLKMDLQTKVERKTSEY